MDQTPLPLDTALEIAQENNIVVLRTARSVDLWAGNKKVPGPVRAAIKANKGEVRSMIGEHRVEVCPSPQLHMRAWYLAGQVYRCGLCEQLGIVCGGTVDGDSSRTQ